jgi:hypothetical protein
LVNIIQIDGLSFNQILACFQVKEAELFKRRKGLKNSKLVLLSQFLKQIWKLSKISGGKQSE